MLVAGTILRAWQEDAARSACGVVGAVTLGTIGVWWVAAGAPPTGAATVGAIGATLAFASVPQRTPDHLRATVLLTSAVAALWSVQWVHPLSPLFITAASVLVGLSAALLGRFAAALTLSATILPLGLYAWAPPPGVRLLHPLADPQHVDNWFRYGALVTLAAAGFAVIMGQISAMITQAARGIAERQVRAEERLGAVSAAREAQQEILASLGRTERVRAVGAVSGGLAHFVNNALVVVGDAIEVLPRCGDPARRLAIARELQEVVTETAAVTRELMVLSRQHDDPADQIDLVDEVRRAVDAVRPTLRDDVHVECIGTPAAARVRPTALRQMVVSLLVNAAAAISGSGRIRVRVWTSPEGPALAVEDNGEGMSRDVAARATEPFFSTRGSKQHAGLGLTVVSRLVEGADGALTIATKAGIGTSVRVTFPPLEPHAQRPAGREPAPLHPHDLATDTTTEQPAAHAVVWPEGAEDWRRQVIIQSGKVATPFVALATLTATAAVWASDAPLSRYAWSSFALLPFLIVGGWAPNLTSRTRLAVLVGGTYLAAASSIAVTFLAATANVVLLVGVALASLLGSRQSAIASVIGVAVLYCGVGALVSVDWLHPDPTFGSIGTPALWLRLVVNITLANTLLAMVVDLGVGTASRWTEKLQEAEHLLFVATARETAEIKRIEAYLQQQARAEDVERAGRVLGTVIHDLNNVLFVFSSSAAELESEDLSDHDVAAIVRDLTFAFEQASSLSSQLRPGDLPASPAPTALNLSREANQALSVLRPSLRPNLQFEAKIDEHAWANLSAADFRRVLFNLVTNARDAIDGPGTLSVRLWSADAQVRLEVSDTGCGIDDATLARLFQPYFTTKATGKGTGLGLASVRAVLDRSGGTVTVDSSPGQGARFRVAWPAVPPAPDGEPSLDVAAAEDATPTGIALVADDNPRVRAVLTRCLRRGGLAVHEAADGTSADHALRSGVPFAAIIVDGVMPGLPTAAVLRTAAERHPKAALFLVSGHLPEDLRAELHSGLGVTFLPKPFSGRELVRRVHERLSPVSPPQ